MRVKSLRWCLTLHDPMDCSLPGASVHGILLAKVLKWVAMPSSRGSSPQGDQIPVSCVAVEFFTGRATGAGGRFGT